MCYEVMSSTAQYCESSGLIQLMRKECQCNSNQEGLSQNKCKMDDFRTKTHFAAIVHTTNIKSAFTQAYPNVNSNMVIDCPIKN
jgi:hypothetical protein